jgi:hypothetical protein
MIMTIDHDMDTRLALQSLELQLQNTLLTTDTSYGEDEEELDDERDSLTSALGFDEEISSGGSELREQAISPQLEADAPQMKKPRSDIEFVEAAVQKASEQVIVTNTIQEYARCVAYAA